MILNIPITVQVVGQAGSNVCGRNAHIIVSLAPAYTADASVSGYFKVNGVVVAGFTPSKNPNNFQWEWTGILPSEIHAGQSFVAAAEAHMTGDFMSINGTGQTTSMLEQVTPWVNIDQFQSPKAVVQLPGTFVMTGDAGEGIQWPYGISQVQYQVGNGPFINADPVTFAPAIRWSAHVSLPAVGDTTITVRALDPYGGMATRQVPIRVMQFPMPSPVDPTLEKTRALQIPTTGSITSWTRLEPQVAGADMAVSSNARVFDPLWFMARQWQMGEFQGEDTGSPVQARVRATNAPLTRCVFGELSATNNVSRPYDPRQAPLEALVERRRMRAIDANDTRMLSFAVEGGLHFLRMIDLDAKAKKYRAAFTAAYLLQQPATPAEPIDDDYTRRFVDTMIGRAPDARRLAAAFRPTAPQVAFDAALKIAATDLAAVQAVASKWLTWYDSTFAEPASPTDDAWTAPRLEYAVSVATRLSPQATDALTLSASQFDGGRLDWSNFDVNSQLSIDTTGDTGFSSFSDSTVPSPVSFAGAPAARFWEMEDAKVAYGLVPVGPTDLAHLMMIEFASTYGNDWFVVPLSTPVGTVTRVDSLIVTDTFGVKNLVRPIGDPALPPANFSMFQQSTIRNAGGAFGPPKSNCFFLPPTIARSVDSPIVEDVLFMRDEMANVAWGIEKSIEGAAERIVSLMNGSAAPSITAIPSPGPAPRYLLSSPVPTNWIPLLPVQVTDHGALVQRLKRGAMLQPDGTNDPHHARSEALTALGTALLYDEEVPREGVHITRRRRMARWTNGSSWVWTAFRNDVGAGEGSSALEFDQLLAPNGATPFTAPPQPTLTMPAFAQSLAQTTIAIDGPSIAYTTSLANPGASLSDVSLQGWITQGTTRRAAGGQPVVCGTSPAGVLPAGTSPVGGTIGASNSGGGTGTLVAGSATVEVQLLVAGVVTDTKTIAVTLAPNAPATASIATLGTTASSIPIDGTSPTYSASLTNPGASLSNVVLQGWMTQGTTRHAAGGAMVMCGAGVGVLPSGTFPVTGSMVASNTIGGAGTLVAGPAVFELQLLVNGALVQTKTLPVTLAANVPNPGGGAGISVLGTTATSVTIDGPSSAYTATLNNPGSSLSNVVVQGWINQGTARRAAGGTMVVIGPTPGVLPSGSSPITGSIGASNSGSGSGTLTAGPATFELQLLVNGTLADTKTLAITLATNVPSPGGIPSLSGLGTTAATVPIGGAASYSSTLSNSGAVLNNVVLQGWMNQNGARRAAGGAMVMCGAGVGVLPSGTFPVSGSIVASNTVGGAGTLVPGPATFELQLTVNGTLITTKTLPVTLA